jgi:hypothetical protein
MGERVVSSADRFSRPGRRALIAPDLDLLRGPTAGIVDLPHRLVWAPAPAGRFDLSDPYDRMRMYEIVLREAVHPDELTTWLDAGLLADLWPRLFLPRGVRQAWEDAHPHLGAAVAA